MLELDGKTAIVTGGGSNIGRQISLTLSDYGANVIVPDIDTDGGQKTVTQIEQRDGTASFIQADVTSAEEVTDIIDLATDEYGTIDILVNNVGGGNGAALHETTREGFDDDIERTLTSAFLCTREAIPELRKGGMKSVVFISSINALLGGFDQIAYTAAKGGLHSMMRKLVADYSSDDVRFNTVCAGSVIGNAEVWQERTEEAPDTLKTIEELYPLGRYGKPDDIANLVLFLASSASTWISGTVIPVDGGLTATGNLPGENWWEEL